MVRAGRIAAHTYCTDDRSVLGVERQSATEYVHPADLLPHHGIFRGAVIRRRFLVGYLRTDGVACLQAVQAATGLHCRIQIRGRQRQAAGLS